MGAQPMTWTELEGRLAKDLKPLSSHQEGAEWRGRCPVKLRAQTPRGPVGARTARSGAAALLVWPAGVSRTATSGNTPRGRHRGGAQADRAPAAEEPWLDARVHSRLWAASCLEEVRMFQWRRRKHRRKDMKEAARTLKEFRSLVGDAGSAADGIDHGNDGHCPPSSTDAARRGLLDTKAVTDGRRRENDAGRAADEWRSDEPQKGMDRSVR